MTAGIARPGRGLILLIALGGIGVLILIALGTWQVERLIWKQDLIARVESRVDLPPTAAPPPAEWPGLGLDAADYLPVTVAGVFRNDEEVHVYAALSEPRGPFGGPGYFVLTPLETAAGWVVIVNRGFVPEARKDPATRAEGQLTGAVTVTGLLRPPQGRNAFTPADDVAANVWFTRDPVTIGAALGIPAERLAPYTIDVAFDALLPGGLPQGGETTISFPNNHLQYALTWYGLAIALVAMMIAYVGRARRGLDAETEANNAGPGTLA